MSLLPAAADRAIFAAETVFLLTGLYGIWAFQLRKGAGPLRAGRVAHWPLLLSGLFTLAALGFMGAVAGSLFAKLVLYGLPAVYAQDADFRLILENACLHLGVVGGLCASGAVIRAQRDDVPPVYETSPPAPRLPPNHIVGVGFITFCVCLVVLIPVAMSWTFLLKLLGVDVVQQELVEIFGDTEDRLKLVAMTVTAVVIAPLTEEIVFRAGLYRWLRTRVRKPAALLITAVLFASLHMNSAAFAPLAVLSVLFCLAYERTGRISVAIIAHGLFNLNTIVLILAGIDI